MLTKDDLKAIQKLVRSETTDIVSSEVTTIKNDLQTLNKEVSGLNNNGSSLQKDMKSVKKSISKIDETQSAMLKMLNEDDVKLHKRVEKIEKHLGISN